MYDNPPCRGMFHLFFATQEEADTGTVEKGKLRAAADVCRTCPYVAQCDADADEYEPTIRAGKARWTHENP